MASISLMDRLESPMVDTTTPSPGLLRALSEAFSSHGLSDLTIRTSDGGEFHVHKKVVCKKSRFFDNAANGPFKEAASGVIEMPNDPPTAVAAILLFLYKNKYDCYGVDDGPYSTDWRFHLDAYIAGAIYNLMEFKLYAKSRFTATIYRLGSLACAVIPKAIWTLYDSTPDTDRVLRDWFEEFCSRNIGDLLTQPDFLDFMATHGPFRHAIARATKTERTRVQRVDDHVVDLQHHLGMKRFCGPPWLAYYCCPNEACGYKMFLNGPGQLETVYCLGCKKVSPEYSWDLVLAIDE